MVDSSPDIRRRIASIRPEYVLRCSWMFYNCSQNLGNVLTQTNCRSTTQYCRTKALFYIVPRGALLYYRVWMHIYDDYIKKKPKWSDAFRGWWIYKIFMLCGLCLAWVEKNLLQFKEWCRENSTYLSWSCLSIGTDLIHKSNAAKQIGYTCNNLLTVVCYRLLPIRHAMHTNNPFNEWGKYQCIH